MAHHLLLQKRNTTADLRQKKTLTEIDEGLKAE